MTNFKSKYLSRTLLSDHGSYVLLHQRNTSFPTVYNMTPFGEKNVFFHYDMTSHHLREKKIFLSKGVILYTVGKLVYADSESHKDHSLKMKSSGEISIWNWSRDFIWPISNRNISRGLYFQTMVPIWFWISITLAFQRYITLSHLKYESRLLIG